MTENQLKELYLDTEHGTFTPNYAYDDFILNEETEEYEYIGLVIHKSAQEVYDEWLENKDKPVEPPVDQMEILQSEVAELGEYVLTLEMKNLELEETSTLNSEYVLDLDTRLTNIELNQTN